MVNVYIYIYLVWGGKWYMVRWWCEVSICIWYVYIICVCVFYLYCLYIYRLRDHDEKTEKLKEATKKGLFAIAIAYFSKVDLVITPFWIVWTAVYFSHGWI